MNWKQCNELQSVSNKRDQNIHFLCTSSVKAGALLNHFNYRRQNEMVSIIYYLREYGGESYIMKS
jgi:hypothetical protein